VTRLALSSSKGVLLAAATFFSLSCGAASLMTLPAGPGAPASDGAAAIAQATSACRAISTITLEMSVSGSVSGHRVRGQLVAGLAAPASARLEAAASFGQPLFVFVAANGDASVLLPRDKRVLEHGAPSDVLDAVAGVPLDAKTLRHLITGCTEASSGAGARSVGDNWRVVTEGADDIYIRRDFASAPWRLVATVHRSTALTASRSAGWRAEYSMFENNLPGMVRLVSVPAGRFDLQLALSQIELNVALGAEAFRVDMPKGVSPISLDELRQSGPLGEK
jgi:hypothetical protein